jgi:hypothetical protein
MNVPSVTQGGPLSARLQAETAAGCLVTTLTTAILLAQLAHSPELQRELLALKLRAARHAQQLGDEAPRCVSLTS